MTCDQSTTHAITPLCSIIVTTWRRPELLCQTIQSMSQQTYTKIEIVVVSDGEDEDVRAIAQQYHGHESIRWVFHPENRGLPAARNTGAREASGDVLLFLDDDVIADPALVSTHMAHHQHFSGARRIAVISMATEERETPLTSYIDKRLEDAWKRTIETTADALSATGLQSVGEEVERSIWLGLNCSIPRDLFLEHEGFNEHFRASDEETELGLRLYLAGVEFVFEPQRMLVHRNSKTLESYFRKSWAASGNLHPYRVLELGQKNPQTQQFASLFHGYFLDRMVAKLGWSFSSPLISFAAKLKPVVEASKQPLLFGLWGRVCQSAEYWNHVKETGCSFRDIQQAAGRSKTALMLHSISEPRNPDESSYYLSPRKFHRFMQWFRFAGYKTATTRQWIDDGVPADHVLLTFDDGYDDLYTELFPFLVENRMTALIFLVAEQIGASNVWDQQIGLRARNLLTLNQVREMQRYGLEFGSHTLTHPYLPDSTDNVLHREVSGSKKRLEDLLGVEVCSFAYPSGGVDRRVRSAVANAGYKAAFTILPGSNWWNDPLCQRRAEVNNYTSIVDFAWKLRAGLGLTQSLGARLRSLQNSLPSNFLRSAAGRLGRIGHKTAQHLSRESRNRRRG